MNFVGAPLEDSIVTREINQQAIMILLDITLKGLISL
jgi:hypothetical protein